MTDSNVHGLSIHLDCDIDIISKKILHISARSVEGVRPPIVDDIFEQEQEAEYCNKDFDNFGTGETRARRSHGFLGQASAAG